MSSIHDISLQFYVYKNLKILNMLKISQICTLNMTKYAKSNFVFKNTIS